MRFGVCDWYVLVHFGGFWFVLVCFGSFGVFGSSASGCDTYLPEQLVLS